MSDGYLVSLLFEGNHRSTTTHFSRNERTTDCLNWKVKGLDPASGTRSTRLFNDETIQCTVRTNGKAGRDIAVDSTLNENASSFPCRSQNGEFAYVSRSGKSDATLEKHAPAGPGTPHSVAEVSERLKSCLQLYDEDGIEAPAEQSERSMFCDTWSETSEFSANNANDVFTLPACVSPSFRSLGRADSGCVPSPRITPTKAQHCPENFSHSGTGEPEKTLISKHSSANPPSLVVPGTTANELRRDRRSCSLNSSSTTVCGAESDAPPWASASTTAYMSWSPDERCQLSDVYFVDVHQQVSRHSCKTMDCNCSKSTRLLKDEQAAGFDPIAPKVVPESMRPSLRCAGPGALSAISSYCTPIAVAAASVPARLCRKLKLLPSSQPHVTSLSASSPKEKTASESTSWPSYDPSTPGISAANLNSFKSRTAVPSGPAVSTSRNRISSAASNEKPRPGSKIALYSILRRSVPLITLPCSQGLSAIRHHLHPAGVDSRAATATSPENASDDSEGSKPERLLTKVILSPRKKNSQVVVESKKHSGSSKPITEPLSYEFPLLSSFLTSSSTPADCYQTAQLQADVHPFASFLSDNVAASVAEHHHDADSGNCYRVNELYFSSNRSERKKNGFCLVIGIPLDKPSHFGAWCFAEHMLYRLPTMVGAVASEKARGCLRVPFPRRSRQDTVGLGVPLGNGVVKDDEEISERGLRQYLYVAHSIRRVARAFQRIIKALELLFAKDGGWENAVIPDVDAYQESTMPFLSPRRSQNQQEERLLAEEIRKLIAFSSGNSSPNLDANALARCRNGCGCSDAAVAVLTQVSSSFAQRTNQRRGTYPLLAQDQKTRDAYYKATPDIHKTIPFLSLSKTVETTWGVPASRKRCLSACWTEVVLFVETILCLRIQQKQKALQQRSCEAHKLLLNPASFDTSQQCHQQCQQQCQPFFSTESSNKRQEKINSFVDSCHHADEGNDLGCFRCPFRERPSSSFSSAYWIVLFAFWIERRLHRVAGETDAPWLLDQFCICQLHSTSGPSQMDELCQPLEKCRNVTYASAASPSSQSALSVGKPAFLTTASAACLSLLQKKDVLCSKRDHFSNEVPRHIETPTNKCSPHLSTPTVSSLETVVQRSASSSRCNAFDNRTANRATQHKRTTFLEATLAPTPSISLCDEQDYIEKTRRHALDCNCRAEESVSETYMHWGPQIDTIRRFLVLCFCAWSWIEDEPTTTGSMVAVLQHVWWCTDVQITLGLRRDAAQRRNSPSASLARVNACFAPVKPATASGNEAASLNEKNPVLGVPLCEAVALTSKKRLFPQHLSVSCSSASSIFSQLKVEKPSTFFATTAPPTVAETPPRWFSVPPDYYAEYLALPTTCSTTTFEAQVFTLMKALGYCFSAPPSVLSLLSFLWCQALRERTCCGKRLVQFSRTHG